MKRFVPIFTFLVLICATTALAAAFPGITVKEAQVKEVIADFVRQKTANLGVETTIRKIGYSGDLQLPAGVVSYEVQSPRQWEGWGRANLALVVRVNDRVEKNIPVNVEVEALADTVVAVHPLERGDVIGENDVAIQKRDISSIQGRVYRTADQVVGKRVKNSIRANTPLKGDLLERIPLVKSGQLVTIIAENQSLRLTATGRARGTGAEGDVVMVQNLGSLKELPARVIDANTVQVDF